MMTKMVTGIYQKHIKYCKNGCVFSFYSLEDQRTYTLSGNVPKIENKSGVKTKQKTKKKKEGSLQGVSVVIKVAFKEGNDIQNHYGTKSILEVSDYEIPRTERTENRLVTLGYEPDDFFENLKIHKQIGCLWKELKNSKNPYEHYSFEKADPIYKNLNGFYESDNRIKVINRNVIQYFRDKDRYYYSLQEYIKVFRKIEGTGAFARMSHRAILSYFVTNREFEFDGNYVWDKEVKDALSYVKNRFTRSGFSKKSFVPNEIIDQYLSEHESDYSEEQKDCIRSLSNDGITIITGGAGTGKTTVIKGIIDVYKRHFDTGYLLLAPTGKASRRIAIKSDCDAYTMHHALRKSLENDFIFYKENNPFPEMLFVTDESSMIDMLLMRDVLRAISTGSKIIFVGDYNQLEAVGVGSPFHEMIDAGLCTVLELTKNFRQADGNAILENAEAVLHGESFFEGEGVHIHDISLTELSKYVSEDTINISPYRKICSAINSCIYKKHKDDVKFQGEYYYPGCSVVFTKNTENYSNGDTGRVLNFSENEMKVVIDDTLDVITVTHEDLENIRFGYALTAHKVQGSEYDRIKVFLPKEATSFSANPNMLYTIITRARQEVDIYYYTE